LWASKRKLFANITNPKQALPTQRFSSQWGDSNKIKPLPFTSEEKLDTKNGQINSLDTPQKSPRKRANVPGPVLRNKA